MVHYFDDFPCIVLERFAEVAEVAVSGLMALLVWDLKPPTPVGELLIDQAACWQTQLTKVRTP